MCMGVCLCVCVSVCGFGFACACVGVLFVFVRVFLRVASFVCLRFLRLLLSRTGQVSVCDDNNLKKQSKAPTHTGPPKHKTPPSSVCCSLEFFVFVVQFENQGQAASQSNKKDLSKFHYAQSWTNIPFQRKEERGGGPASK